MSQIRVSTPLGVLCVTESDDDVRPGFHISLDSQSVAMIEYCPGDKTNRKNRLMTRAYRRDYECPVHVDYLEGDVIVEEEEKLLSDEGILTKAIFELIEGTVLSSRKMYREGIRVAVESLRKAAELTPTIKPSGPEPSDVNWGLLHVIWGLHAPDYNNYDLNDLNYKNGTIDTVRLLPKAVEKLKREEGVSLELTRKLTDYFPKFAEEMRPCGTCGSPTPVCEGEPVAWVSDFVCRSCRDEFD